MDMTTQPQSYNARSLDSTQRKQLALNAMNPSTSITDLSDQHKVSRKFVHQQKKKAVKAVNDAFESKDEKAGKVLFYLPVTFAWLCQLILCLVFHCRANHRGIQKLLRDAFDHEISYSNDASSIFTLVQNKSIAKFSTAQLKNMKLTENIWRKINFSPLFSQSN
jgi:hypothetical protein